MLLRLTPLVPISSECQLAVIPLRRHLMSDRDEWQWERAYVIEINARDLLSSGAYRIAKKVSGYLDRDQAQREADKRNAEISLTLRSHGQVSLNDDQRKAGKRNAEVTWESRDGPGLVYLVWTNLDIDRARRFGTLVVP
jgi:hypothetical protein